MIQERIYKATRVKVDIQEKEIESVKKGRNQLPGYIRYHRS
jgi:hypothetical protein